MRQCPQTRCAWPTLWGGAARQHGVDTTVQHIIYRPQPKLREGDVLRTMCQSFCSQEEGVSLWTPLNKDPQTKTTPKDRDHHRQRPSKTDTLTYRDSPQTDI